jgi:hypothetical protein
MPVDFFDNVCSYKAGCCRLSLILYAGIRLPAADSIGYLLVIYNLL